MTSALPQIYLASSSPRRRLLLDQLGVRYQVLKADMKEQIDADESPEQFVARMALAKARLGWNILDQQRYRPVLGADTVVVVDGQVLGKPRDRDQGLDMLTRLSGRSHQVLTAVALVAHQESLRISESMVRFRDISVQEREAYWLTGEGCDKAGSYAIQGRAAAFISRLEGSYSTVMGLPLYEAAELLRAHHIDVLSQHSDMRPLEESIL